MKPVSLLLTVTALIVAAVLFTWHIAARMNNPGTDDFPIFIEHAHHYLEHGEIYQRSDNYALTYVPAAATYKFPPLYVSALTRCISLGYNDDEIRHGLGYVQIGVFLLALLTLFITLYPVTPLIVNLLALTAGVLFFPVLNDNLKILQPEPFMLLALAIALYFLSRRKVSRRDEFISGIMTGLAASIKLYPALISFYYIASKRWAGLWGMIAGFIIINLVTVSMVGLGEHIFFYTKILPALLSEQPGINDAINLSPSALPLYFGLPATQARVLSKILLMVVLAFYLKKYFSTTASQNQDPRVPLVDFSIITIISVMALANSWWNYQILLVLPAMVACALVFEKGLANKTQLSLLLIAFLLFFTSAWMAMETVHGFGGLGNLGRFLYYLSRGGIGIVVLVLLWRWRFSQ